MLWANLGAALVAGLALYPLATRANTDFASDQLDGGAWQTRTFLAAILLSLVLLSLACGRSAEVSARYAPARAVPTTLVRVARRESPEPFRALPPANDSEAELPLKQDFPECQA